MCVWLILSENSSWCGKTFKRSLTSEPFPMFHTFKMHIGLNRPQIAKIIFIIIKLVRKDILVLHIIVGPVYQKFIFQNGRWRPSWKLARKSTLPIFNDCQLCLVLIDTQRVLNQKVSFMFHFFPGWELVLCY